MILAAGLVVGLIRPHGSDHPVTVRTEAAAAVESLQAGDLTALEQQLSSNRGRRDFAYYFTSQTTPRELGDALSSVAGSDEPLKAGVDPHAYEMALTDLAGVLSLATHGTGSRALPTTWTEEFAVATTTPSELYDSTGARADQDMANKQNLLLLLSRGHWSIDFLKAITAAYWDYDHAKRNDAWPSAKVKDAKYAPAPNGKYLTDGVLALTAALTANPEASGWAFTQFQPGTETVKYDDTDHPIGKFAHYLFFDHKFPGADDGKAVGMTATLTALSSAIEASGETAKQADLGPSVGPRADSQILQAYVKSAQDREGCSWNPLDYGHCVVDVAGSMWRWIRHWGHLVLDILAVVSSTVAGVAVVLVPPPFGEAIAGGAENVAVTAASLNATWYVIEGDYASAGLSLAAAVPGLGFARIAKYFKTGIRAEEGAAAAARAERAGADADDVAKAAKEIRAAAGAEAKLDQVVTVEYLASRPSFRPSTVDQVRAKAKTRDGYLVDPNSKRLVPPSEVEIGHKPGYEARCLVEKALREGMTRRQYLDLWNNPDYLQLEGDAENRSHKYEAKVCAV